MIILHLAWYEGRPQLWGESRVSAPEEKKSRAPRPLPFGARFDALKQALETLGVVSAKPRGQNEALSHLAWLPSAGGLPVPSSPLIADLPEASFEPVLAPWKVATMALSWEPLRDLLCVVPGKELLAPGLLAGASLDWWSQLFRLAVRLVLRGAYLPDLVRGYRGYQACWKPVPEGEFSEALDRIVHSMPGSARCLSDVESQEPPLLSARDLTEIFLGWCVDRLVRERQSRVSRSVDSLHEAWLAALLGSEAIVEWKDESELSGLASQLLVWRRPVEILARSRMRLCFRLEEPYPKTGEEQWFLKYLLQPLADKSLLVELPELSKPRSNAAALLKKIAGEPAEYLLSALGQAAALSPLIAESLTVAYPPGKPLDTSAAYTFLSEYAPALEAAGFGVFLPPWWRSQKRTLSARAMVTSSSIPGRSLLSLTSLVQVKWSLALGEDPLTPEELEMLASAKSSLVRLRGQWMDVGGNAIRDALRAFEKLKESRVSTFEALQMSLGAKAGPAGLPISSVDAKGWINDLLEDLKDPVPDREPHDTRDLSWPAPSVPEERGLSWLAFLCRWGLGACLADDMGLGKTAQTLALIARERKGSASGPPDLPDIRRRQLVARSPALHSRAARPDSSRIVPQETGGVPGRSGELRAGGLELQPGSPGSGRASVRHLGCIALDEAQNVKNPEARQSKAVRTLEGDYRIALTGTPVENHAGDLWALMEFLNPGLLGSRGSFRKQFVVPIQAGGDRTAADQLKKITSPFILRRLKTDRSIISDLPDKQEFKVYCTLTREQASLYRAYVADIEKALQSAKAGIQRKGLVLAALMRLKQICNHPSQFLADGSALEGRSGKLARLVEMLDEVLQSGEKALVFTQFSEMGGLLERYLEDTFGRDVLFLHGGTPKPHRDRMVTSFQREAHGPPIFILSLKAGGTGLNLTRANHVFHFDRWWNPAVENQATDRAFRIGQLKNVQVHKFICGGTLEERIDEIIERKRAVANDVVSSGEEWLTELSNDALRSLLTLRAQVEEE